MDVQDPELQKLFIKFDRQLLFQLDNFRSKIEARLDRLEDKSRRIERRIQVFAEERAQAVEEVKQQCEEELKLEREDKMVLNQWTNGFLSDVKVDEIVTPIDYGFARFALNVALSAEFESPQKMITADLPNFMVSMMKLPQEIVVGPVVLGLVHMSLHQEMKHAIAESGAVPLMVDLLRKSRSTKILMQCAKLVASLALSGPNKPLLANNGAAHALLHLLDDKFRRELTQDLKNACAGALTNMLLNSDANRNLVVEIGGIRPLQWCMSNLDQFTLLLNLAKTMCNIAYCNTFGATSLLQENCDDCLVTTIRGCDVLRDHDMYLASMWAFANMANTEMNQAHLASGRAIEEAVRTCKHSPNPQVVGAAASAICAMVYRAKANKMIVGDKGAVEAFARAAWRNAFEGHKEALKRVCDATNSLLLYHPNQFRFVDCGGLVAFIRLCMEIDDPEIQVVCARTLSFLIPDNQTLWRLKRDGAPFPIDELGGVKAFLRVRDMAFPDTGDTPVPPWLSAAIRLLQASDTELRDGNLPSISKQETADRLGLVSELESSVISDHAVLEAPNLRGLMFSLY